MKTKTKKNFNPNFIVALILFICADIGPILALAILGAAIYTINMPIISILIGIMAFIIITLSQAFKTALRMIPDED